MSFRINNWNPSLYIPGWYGPAKNCEECGEWNCYLLDKEYFCKKCGESLNPTSLPTKTNTDSQDEADSK